MISQDIDLLSSHRAYADVGRCRLDHFLVPDIAERL